MKNSLQVIMLNMEIIRGGKIIFIRNKDEDPLMENMVIVIFK